MVGISQLGSMNSGTTSGLEAYFKQISSGTSKLGSGDVVSISDEAQELSKELQEKKKSTSANLTEEEKKFAKVANALPDDRKFLSMLDWISGTDTTKKEAKSSIAMKKEAEQEVDNNTYMKDPQKYATLWKNLYKQYNELMEDVGLNADFAEHRELMNNTAVKTKLQTEFVSSIDNETKKLLNYFKISL